MSELPSELVALSKAAGEDEKRRALETAVAIVALVDGGARWDAAVGALAAAAVALAAWQESGRWLVGAIVLCVTFPVAARTWRPIRLRRLRRRFAADPHQAWRMAATAWERATPGQRAALMRITKASS